jgi:hypothetical protein
LEPTDAYAACGVLHADRVALGVHEQRLLARERALDRLAEQPRGERSVRLVAHVLLAAEAATVRDELDGDALAGHGEHVGDLVAVVPHALTAGVHVHRAVRPRFGDRGLRLEERLLDALGLKGLAHHERGRGKRCVDIAARVGRSRENISGKRPHRIFGVADRRYRIGDRTQYVVGDRHQLSGRARSLAVGGHDDGEHITEVRGDTALGDHHRPVLVQDADAQRAGYVGCGEHCLDARQRERGRCVDGQHTCTGVVGQLDGRMQHAR